MEIGTRRTLPMRTGAGPRAASPHGMLTAMADPDVRLERLDGTGGTTALLTVSDPKRRNAMTAALSERLVAVLEEVGADESVGTPW